jgi:hypothetical protein
MYAEVSDQCKEPASFADRTRRAAPHFSCDPAERRGGRREYNGKRIVSRKTGFPPGCCRAEKAAACP